jgi:hypothetical protein
MHSDQLTVTMLPNPLRPTRGLAEVYSGIPFTQGSKDALKHAESMK